MLASDGWPSGIVDFLIDNPQHISTRARRQMGERVSGGRGGPYDALPPLAWLAFWFLFGGRTHAKHKMCRRLPAGLPVCPGSTQRKQTKARSDQPLVPCSRLLAWLLVVFALGFLRVVFWFVLLLLLLFVLLALKLLYVYGSLGPLTNVCTIWRS